MCRYVVWKRKTFLSHKPTGSRWYVFHDSTPRDPFWIHDFSLKEWSTYWTSMVSRHVQQVVSWFIHPELGKLIDSNRRGVSFISPSASCEKLKKVCVPLLNLLRNGMRFDFGLSLADVICECLPLLKSLRNGLRCDFGLASAYVIRWCSVKYHRGGGHNTAQWIVITKANPDLGLDTSIIWFIPGSDTRSHRFRRLLVTRRATIGEISLVQ